MSEKSQNQLEEMVLSFVKADWRKTALVIANVLHQCEDRGIQMPSDWIFQKIVDLCESGRIESQGNLSDWRHSEVRIRS